MKTIKVGDVVAWADVPDGALVREPKRHGDGGVVLYSLRRGEFYRVVHNVWGWRRFAPCRPWSEVLRLPAWAIGECVTIIALNLTGDETAEDLRRLAEVFQLREHLMSTGDDSIWFGEHIDDLAPQLQAAGWRPGMTAEDAARLLAEVKP